MLGVYLSFGWLALGYIGWCKVALKKIAMVKCKFMKYRRRHKKSRGGYVAKPAAKAPKKAKGPKTKVRNADGRVHVKGHTRGYPYNSI